MLYEVMEPHLFVFRKQKRDEPEKVTPRLTYYVLDGIPSTTAFQCFLSSSCGSFFFLKMTLSCFLSVEVIFVYQDKCNRTVISDSRLAVSVIMVYEIYADPLILSFCSFSCRSMLLLGQFYLIMMERYVF